jgi:hypothetical protein
LARILALDLARFLALKVQKVQKVRKRSGALKNCPFLVLVEFPVGVGWEVAARALSTFGVKRAI